MEQSEFVFKYTGESEIDVNLLIESLKNVSAAIQHISLDSIGTTVDLKVKPFHEGSFEWIFALRESIQMGDVSIFLEAISGDGIIEKFKTVVEVVKFFSGKEVKEPVKLDEGKYQFTNDEGEVKIVESESIGNYFGNGGDAVVINIENVFIAAGENENVDGIELLDKAKKQLLKISKDELKKSKENIKEKRAKAEIAKKTPDTRIVKKNKVIVYAAKPDLVGQSMWRVIFDGHQIEAKLTDQQFQKDVQEGKYSFKSGTAMLIDLHVIQALDKKTNVYRNTGYSIAKVYSLPEPEQQELFAG